MRRKLGLLKHIASINNEKKNKNNNFIVELSIHSAEGFYQVGLSIAQHIEKENKIFGFQGLMPTAVNFNLAVELYLKALHLLIYKKSKSGHQLWNLFKSLPKNTKENIESQYKSNFDKSVEGLSSYKFILTKGKNKNDEDKRPKDNDKNPEIKKLLLTHNDSFEKWRYIHEINNPEGFEYEYDFKTMYAFTEAIRNVIEAKLASRGIKFKMVKITPTNPAHH